MKPRCPNCGSTAQIRVIQQTEVEVDEDHTIINYTCVCGCSEEVFTVKHHRVILQRECG